MNYLIKIISINPLMILIILFSLMIGRLQEFLIIFGVTTIHEFAHIITARYHKLNINKITISPIGLMANIDYTSSAKKANDVAVSLAGPISNLFMICTGIYLNSNVLGQSETMSFFILVNVSLLFLNILPVLPLDGGRIFKVIILTRIGYHSTQKVFSILTKSLSGIIMGIGIIQVLNNHYNFSLLIIGIFIYLYKYKDVDLQFDLIRELYLKKQKIYEINLLQIKYFAVLHDAKAIDVLKNFHSNKYNIVITLDNELLRIGELTETQIFEGIMKGGANVMIGEL